MFEISELIRMKLPELQEIAKKANISKYRGLKKKNWFTRYLTTRLQTLIRLYR
ncbi:Rho termination factor N-terminal domain-containing protein [Flavobacterium sp. J372]|uniref:Rho termination factor N-terminal domain-containing protein n=1 Tax=Flavobacterium sp. J372 TaxID=2898436 RepID=UPI0035B4FAF5